MTGEHLSQAAKDTIAEGFALVPRKPNKAMIEAMLEIEEADGGFSIRNAWTHIINAANGDPGNYGDHIDDAPMVIPRCTCKICCLHRAAARKPQK